MHSFVYIFWTENNTSNATFTQTLNLNLPCTKKKCVTLAFTAEFSDTFISQALLNVLCTIVILVNGFLFFFLLFRGSFNSCRQKSSTKFAYILQIFNLVDWIENKTFNAKCVCTEQKKIRNKTMCAGVSCLRHFLGTPHSHTSAIQFTHFISRYFSIIGNYKLKIVVYFCSIFISAFLVLTPHAF